MTLTPRTIAPALISLGRAQGRAGAVRDAAKALRDQVAAIEKATAMQLLNLPPDPGSQAMGWDRAQTIRALLDRFLAIADQFERSAQAIDGQAETQDQLARALIARLDEPGALGREIGERVVRRVRRLFGAP